MIAHTGVQQLGRGGVQRQANFIGFGGVPLGVRGHAIKLLLQRRLDSFACAASRIEPKQTERAERERIGTEVLSDAGLGIVHQRAPCG